MKELPLYYQLSEDELQGDYRSVVSAILPRISSQWVDEYNHSTARAEIMEFDDDGFTFFFDTSEDNSTSFVAGMTKEARMVAAFGVTRSNTAKRNRSRMQGFIGGFESIPGYHGYDKGHFISHKIGGMLDQNLFPQKTEVNRGWSEEGKRYRSIERFCERNPGIFMFSRPIYRDLSWIPSEIEIGYLSKEFRFVIERVKN
jgi:hypothetical protein